VLGLMLDNTAWTLLIGAILWGNYLYRAVDSLGQTIDFLLSAQRHTVNPRTIIWTKTWPICMPRRT
jgi:hypothetical protein